MAPTENRAHEAGNEVARRSTTVYIVGVASTKYIKRMKLVLKYVVTRSTVVYIKWTWHLPNIERIKLVLK